MKKQKAKPNCSRGYSCGMSCINVKLMCRQDGLAGQFVKLAENYFQQGRARPIAQREAEADLRAKGAKLIGEGNVYSHEGKAIKFSNTNSKAKLIQQYGEANGRALFEKDEAERKQAVAGYKLAEQLGIGPKIYDYEAYDEPNGQRVHKLSMELLDGYDVGFDFSDERAGKAFIKQMSKAHKAGVLIDDLKEDNVMYDTKSGRLLFIDQGGLRQNASPKDIADQLFDEFGWRPLAANLLKARLGKNKQYKSADGEGSEQMYQSLVNELYKLMEQ